MALIVSFQNISNLAEISEYKVDVWVNNRHIAGPFIVSGHRRSDGWQELVKQFGKNPLERYDGGGQLAKTRGNIKPHTQRLEVL
jgi:hypothetical protein